MPGLPSPFDPDDAPAYDRWRAWKLRHRAERPEDLMVDVADPCRLSALERAALLRQIGRRGAAIYRTPARDDAPGMPRALGTQLGLLRLDANWLAEEDGVSRIEVSRPAAGAPRADFIPYTERAIRWHTDGYYHPQRRQIRGMILHCVRPAARGGETALLDPELAYIALRDEAPALLRALMHPRAMTIPAREDDSGVARAAQSGPVFSLGATRRLHLRYTARTRSIEWRDDALTREAAARIAALLDGELAGVLRLTLAAGMGLVGHNVLHERTAFADDPAAPRLLLRLRYLDRVASAVDDEWLRDIPAAAQAEGARP